MTEGKPRNVIVVFDGSFKNYNAGEIAGFPPRAAADLVAAGKAHYHKTPRASLAKVEPEVGDVDEGVGEGDDTDTTDPDDLPNPEDYDLDENGIPKFQEELRAEEASRGKWFIFAGEVELAGPFKKKELKAAGYL